MHRPHLTCRAHRHISTKGSTVTGDKNSRRRRQLMIAFWLSVCMCVAGLSAYLGESV